MLCQTLRSATLVFVFLGFEQLCVEQLHLCKPRAGGPGHTLATHNHKTEKSEQFLDSLKTFVSSSFFSFYFSIMQSKNPVQNCCVAFPRLHSRNNFHCHKKIFTPLKKPPNPVISSAPCTKASGFASPSMTSFDSFRVV